MVSVRASNEEGATEDIAGSNPASDTKTKPTRSGTIMKKQEYLDLKKKHQKEFEDFPIAYDKTPFAEVAENYDVVGRRGDLWILEDKVDE